MVFDAAPLPPEALCGCPEYAEAMTWADRANELLYDGETVRETVPVGDGEVYVTTHRLLAFRGEDAGGANFRGVDRPNVDGVAASAESDRGALASAVAWGGLGAALAAGGVVVEVADFFATPEALEQGAVAGAGGVVSLLRSAFDALALVDEGVAVLGGVLLAVAAWYAARYWRSRERVVTVAVAGDGDVVLPVGDDETPEDAEAAVAELRRHLET